VRGLETVFIVALTPADDIICVRQWRYLFNERMLEFPAGSMNRGETPLQAAQRELAEETGYSGVDWKEITWFAPCNGLSDERCHVFLVRAVTPAQAQPEASEDITVERHSSRAIDDLIQQQSITDGMTLAAWQLVKSHL
jgi:ADP-ribose pyrophosphatase